MYPITATIQGQIQGEIWMPCITCTKSFTIGEDDFRYSDGSRPSLRDMVLRAICDGDFQSANISEGYLKLTMSKPRNTKRVRYFDLRKFASIADCIAPEDSIVYPESEEV